MSDGRFNKYTCLLCGGHIFTVDREEGTTSAMLACRATEGCEGTMQSSMYTLPDGLAVVPTFEWRKPTPEEYGLLNEALREHVDKGGLLIFPLSKDAVMAEAVGQMREATERVLESIDIDQMSAAIRHSGVRIKRRNRRRFKARPDSLSVLGERKRLQVSKTPRPGTTYTDDKGNMWRVGTDGKAQFIKQRVISEECRRGEHEKCKRSGSNWKCVHAWHERSRAKGG